MSFNIEIFRNSAIGDLLELFNIHHYPSNFSPQKGDSEPERVDSSSNSESGSLVEHAVETADALYEEKPNDTNTNAGSQLFGDDDVIDPFLVSWNGPDDPENPKNLCRSIKVVMILLNFLFGVTTYMASAIYVAAESLLESEFHVGRVVGTLPLSVYIVGYGLGPVILSPLSEQPKVGRNWIFVISMFLFFLFQIAAALVQNIGGFIVVRFLAGVACSPFLSVSIATMGDLLEFRVLPYLIGLWSCFGVSGPVLGPLVGGALSLTPGGWRFIFWFLAMLSGVSFLAIVLFYRETSPENILYRRTVRIRRETGDGRYYTKEARKSEAVPMSNFLYELLLRPLIITVKEPGVIAFDFYLAVTYGGYYLFFEGLPLVFGEMYHFTVIETGLGFLGFVVGLFIAYFMLCLYVKYYMPRLKAIKPESLLPLVIVTSWFMPLALFLFGWGAGLHWIVPVIIQLPYIISVYLAFQAVTVYLSGTYPRYVASVFASNNIARAALACSLPLVGDIMYKHTGSDKYPVGWGSSIIGFIMAAMMPIPYIIYRYADRLRGRSSYAN